MRSVAILLASFLTTALISSAAATDFPEGRQNWLVLERKGAGVPEIVTVLRALPATDFRAKFPVLLRISWGYTSLPNGMPTEADTKLGRELYARLDSIFGQKGIYAMSRTGGGGRTMYYYVQNATDHSELMRRYFDSLASISIKITAQNEPGWNSVQEVLSDAK
jgi:Family of unknown function (DUF695)